MRRAAWPLHHQLGVVFAVLLLSCCGASLWLQTRSTQMQQDEMTQRLSRRLAAHIAGNNELMQGGALDAGAVKDLFGKLMVVNPSMEVYLLGPEGRIVAHDAPPGRLQRDAVDLAPVRRFLAGGALPILGDDPRSAHARKVFSAAPLHADGPPAGYVYVVLFGEDRDRLDADLSSRRVLQSALWSMALVSSLGLIAGLVAFRLITRPLRHLTRAVADVQGRGLTDLERAAPALARVGGSGEIRQLQQAFHDMTLRLAAQWRQLTEHEQKRRELFANLSHDLRTPLTSLHGYLETLMIKAVGLSEADRRYLQIALHQSGKVGRLAQELFDLARLDYGVVEPSMETFALPDLLQDVFQKFELAVSQRGQRLVAHIPAGVPAVTADVGLIERVLTNLIDNALRHSPDGGEVAVALRPEARGVRIDVTDSGPGIPPALADQLFVRPLFSSAGGRTGGLGLVIVRRILQLHGGDVTLARSDARGSVFSVALPLPDRDEDG